MNESDKQRLQEIEAELPAIEDDYLYDNETPVMHLCGNMHMLIHQLKEARNYIDNAGQDWMERAKNAEYMLAEVRAENTELKAQLRAQGDEWKRLREALTELMEFHPEDECGPMTEEYWTPEYKAAITKASKALKGEE